MFKLEFRTDNAAFEPGLEHVEVTRILQRISYAVENRMVAGAVKDTNGNTIGNWSIKPE